MKTPNLTYEITLIGRKGEPDQTVTCSARSMSVNQRGDLLLHAGGAVGFDAQPKVSACFRSGSWLKAQQKEN